MSNINRLLKISTAFYREMKAYNKFKKLDPAEKKHSKIPKQFVQNLVKL